MNIEQVLDYCEEHDRCVLAAQLRLLGREDLIDCEGRPSEEGYRYLRDLYNLSRDDSKNIWYTWDHGSKRDAVKLAMEKGMFAASSSPH